MSETALVPLSKDAVSVVTALENAKAWLANAVETTGPAEIAAAKAQIVTAETYARELDLSKDIQQDAQEMVRRAEYALGKAIHRGQEEGVIARQGEHNRFVDLPDAKMHVGTFFKGGSDQAEINAMKSVDPDSFEDALTKAKAEGNLSRANVVRKIKREKVGPGHEGSPAIHADRVADLAGRGYSSRQIAPQLGLSEEYVRRLIKEFGIDAPADKIIRGTRRIDSNRIAERTVQALEGLVTGLDLINYDDIDRTEAGHWAASLNDSLKTLNRFRNQIKEMTQ